MQLNLSLLGAPALQEENGQIIKVPIKGIGLMAYLALSKSGKGPKSRLRALFWSDKSEKKADANLRQLLSKIKSINEDLLDVSLDGVSINHQIITVDVTVLISISKDDYLNKKEELLSLNGQFLEGVEINGEEFEDWIAQRRLEISSLIVEINRHLIQTGELDNSDLLKAYWNILSVDPYEEDIHNSLIRYYIDRGENGMALRHYKYYEKTCREELGVPPSDETRSMIEQMNQSSKEKLAKAQHTNLIVPSQSQIYSKDEQAEVGKPFKIDPPTIRDNKPLLPFIAVLPFETKEKDEVSRVLAHTLSEEICTNFTSSKEYAVLAYNSMQKLSDGTSNLLSYLPVLNVSYLIDGQIYSLKNKYFAMVKVVSSNDFTALWSQTIPISSDVLGSSSFICNVVSDVLGTILATQYADKDPGVGLDAYLKYLKAKKLLLTYTLDACYQARKLLSEVLNVYPDFSLAESMIASSFNNEMMIHGDPKLKGDLLSTSKQHAQNAISIDPLNAFGHKELGYAHLYLNEFDESIESYGAAEKIYHGNAEILTESGDALIHYGDRQQGLEKILRGNDLDPICADKQLYIIASAYYYNGKYKECINTLNQLSTKGIANTLYAVAYAQLGNEKQVSYYRTQLLKTDPNYKASERKEFIPIPESGDTDHFIQGLAKAGIQ